MLYWIPPPRESTFSWFFGSNEGKRFLYLIIIYQGYCVLFELFYPLLSIEGDWGVSGSVKSVSTYPKDNDVDTRVVVLFSSSSNDNKCEYYSAYQASCMSPFMPGTRWCGLCPSLLARSWTTSRNITVSIFSPSMYKRNQSPIFDLHTITSIASRRTNLEGDKGHK